MSRAICLLIGHGLPADLTATSSGSPVARVDVVGNGLHNHEHWHSEFAELNQADEQQATGDDDGSEVGDRVEDA